MGKGGWWRDGTGGALPGVSKSQAVLALPLSGGERELRCCWLASMVGRTKSVRIVRCEFELWFAGLAARKGEWVAICLSWHSIAWAVRIFL